jgi:hypothetical protein
MSFKRRLQRSMLRDRGVGALKVYCGACPRDEYSNELELPLDDRQGIDLAKLKQRHPGWNMVHVEWKLDVARDRAEAAPLVFGLVCPSCANKVDDPEAIVTSFDAYPERSFLMVCCVECGLVTDAPLNEHHGIATSEFAQKQSWFVSVVTPPGQGRFVLAPVCPGCAPKVYVPEMLAHAKKKLRADS